jgi:protein-S-isoprenylcysteine O-methyltransferase Ste14
MTIFSEIINATGASFFVFLFILRVMQFERHEPVPILLAIQAALTAFFLVMHRPVERIAHPIISVIAWVCALLPLAFDSQGAETLYSIPGLLLVLWSLLSLRRAFSIAPEDRGIIMRGPYRFIRHPMYLGELLSLLGLCISAMKVWNWLLFVLFARLILLRIAAEERVLFGYEPYKKSVRWRLIPWVW